MNLRSNKSSFHRPTLLALCGMSVAAFHAHAQDDWTKRFRIGGTVGFGYQAEFSSGGAFAATGPGPGTPGVSAQDHFYDDGYVRVDQTGNAGGFTSYWGYDNASQYNGTDTLTFRSTSIVSQTQTTSTIDDAPYFGFDLAYGTTLAEFARADIGWELGFTFLPMKIAGSDSASVNGLRTVHTYNTGGIALPGAPYQGGNSGVGPVINDVATAAPGEIDAGTLTGSRELRSRLYNIRLGTNARWHLGGRWSLSGGLGFAGGLVTSEYDFNETIAYDLGGTSRFSGSFDSSDFVYGGYAELMLYWRAEKNGELYLGGQYMGMTSVNMESQGRAAKLDLNQGMFITAGIHWAF